MSFQVEAYAADQRAAWNAVVDASANGTFLIRREFMEYHADRFVDASLIIQDAAGRPVAVFPANRTGDRVVSHAGLTYGGLIYLPELRQSACLEVMERVINHYREAGIASLTCKAVPQVFRRVPSEEDLYALTYWGARLVRRDVATVVDLQSGYRFNKGRSWSVNRGRKAGIQVQRQQDPTAFHRLLSQVLQQHDAAPVHTVAELQLLMSRFPQAIHVFGALLEEELLAGALIFDCGQTVHAQYLANSPPGRDCGALDFLLARLMQHEYRERHWFSFGVSTEQGGKVLNEGLIAQKEGFGGFSRCHDFYELALSSNPQ